MTSRVPRRASNAVPALLGGAAFVAWTLLGAPFASAHDDLKPTIERLRGSAAAADSAAAPVRERVQALLDRGELERLEGEFAAAEEDYAAAEALAPAHPRISLCRAALAADQERWARADSLVALAVARGDAGAETFRLWARIHRARGMGLRAIADLDRSLAAPDGWSPDAVVTRARWTHELLGRESEVAFLAAALARDPASIPIALRLAESEAELGRFGRALERLEGVLARCGERCFALRARRADFLQRLGRTLEADAERSAVLVAIAATAPRRPADDELARALRGRLEEQP
jgi:tetratricopeptide (TPR) repeat protein